MPPTSQNPLGDFLRSRRERLRPDALGLAPGRRRRTPGLRREEVAEQAGIGVDWYIRLEQGRAQRPSATTLDALARALRLDPLEHEHLRTLAGAGAPRRFVRETVPPTLKRLLALMPLPAYVTGRRWDILAWNEAAIGVFGDFGKVAEEDRNVLVNLLLNRAARRLFGNAWAAQARHAVTQFRATYDLWATDPTFRALVERLDRDSPEFGRWWRAHDIGAVATGSKLVHPKAGGSLRLDYTTFQSNDDPGLRLVVYIPSG